MCVSGRMRKMCVDGLVAMGLRQATLRVGVSTDAVMRKARSGPSNDRDVSIVERGASASSSTERNPLTGSYNEVRAGLFFLVEVLEQVGRSVEASSRVADW